MDNTLLPEWIPSTYDKEKYLDVIWKSNEMSNFEKEQLTMIIEFFRYIDKRSRDIIPYYNEFEKFEENSHIPIGCLKVYSTLKHLDLGKTLYVLNSVKTKSPLFGKLLDAELNEVIPYIFNHFRLNCPNEILDAIDLFKKIEREYFEITENLDWREKSAITLQNLQSAISLNSLDNKFFYYIGYYLKYNYLRNQNKSLPHKLTEEISSSLLQDDQWKGNEVEYYFKLLNKLGVNGKIPNEIKPKIKPILKGKPSKKIIQLISFYYDNQNSDFKDDFLRSTVKKYYDNENQEITWEQKINSGFGIIPIPMRHNPYKGLHPDQVRPFFTLLRSLIPIDIIKFYKVDQIEHVRFRVKENNYDLNTGDGFSLDFVDALNLILFKESIPYQVVVLNNNKKVNPRKFSSYDEIKSIITIFNNKEWKKFIKQIPPQKVAGWAESDEELVDFKEHLKDLTSAKINPDLDDIDLSKDPKFSMLQNEIGALSPQNEWTQLITHLLTCPLTSNPGKKWIAKVKELTDSIGEENFIKGALSLHAGMIKGDEWFYDDEKLCAMKGMAWILRYFSHKDSLFILKNIIEKSYKKITGGPLNAKLGNIGLESLASIGTIPAYGVMGTMLAKSKYSVFQRAIKSRMKKFKTLLSDYSADELEDIVVPDYGLINNEKLEVIGKYTGKIYIVRDKVISSWEKDGKTIKSVPKEIKDNHPLELKSFSADVKAIKDSLVAQSKRLESTYLSERSWASDRWLEHIYNHGLMSSLASRLIWYKVNDPTISFTINNGSIIDASNNLVTVEENEVIKLWHPAISNVENILKWRNYFFENEIKQPFKQAFREVYLLTPAELNTYDYSMRFNGHYLKGNTLYSLGKTRGWTMSYDQPPFIKIPHLNIIADLMIDGGVLYSECTTKELQFRTYEDKVDAYSTYRLKKVPLNEVPPIILSEIMRDVDLFVAVSGIAYDPFFDQNGAKDLMGYWKDVSFGKKSDTPIAMVRKDLLERLLPKTKVKKHYSFDGNFLVIQGKKNSYKINLGSSNILIQPHDKYLCIVPGNETKKLGNKIWLPFEGGDHTLMTIISKAFLLFDDDKISDPSIVRQL